MANWMAWFGLAAFMVICEIYTGTFYLLMIGLGLAAGGAVALFGAGFNAELIVAAIVGIVATIALRRSKWGKNAKRDSARDPNINLDIGQTLWVDDWSNAGTARAMYRGAMWDVMLEEGMRAVPGTFVIREVRGNRLIVANRNGQ